MTASRAIRLQAGAIGPQTGRPAHLRKARCFQLAALTDGRKRALSALAYHTGRLLAWSGLPEQEVIDRLTNAGIASGLSPIGARRIVGPLARQRPRPAAYHAPAPAALARRHDQSPSGGDPNAHDQASHQHRAHLTRRHNPS